MEEETQLSEISVLKGILALLIDQRARDLEGVQGSEPVEVVLSSAGLDYRAIAGLVGKKPDAVRMMLSRRKS